MRLLGKEVTMFPLYPFNPFIPIGQRNQIKLIDVGGIYELKTNAQQVTDASVDYGINPCYYNALPSTAQIVNFGNEGVVVSDSREAMCAEIDAMLRHSKGVVESVDYHNGVISSCEEMLTRINPQIAKEKQQEQDINNLKSEVSGMKGTLSNIESMLSKALSSGNNFKK